MVCWIIFDDQSHFGLADTILVNRTDAGRSDAILQNELGVIIVIISNICRVLCSHSFLADVEPPLPTFMNTEPYIRERRKMVKDIGIIEEHKISIDNDAVIDRIKYFLTHEMNCNAYLMRIVVNSLM